MKKVNLNIKRDIKPAKKIEITHANLNKKKEKTKKEKTERIIKVKKERKKSVVTSVRFYEEEIEKINNYLKENNISFNRLVKMLLKEKGII